MENNSLSEVLAKEEEKKEDVEELIKKEESTVEESSEESTVEESEEEEEEKKEDVEIIKEHDQALMDVITEREQALLKEVSRLRKKNRQEDVEIKLSEIISTVEDDETVDVTPAEARLFNSWRTESLEEIVEKNPQYKENPKLWERFLQEYNDRIPELVWAKRNNVPVTKSLFRDRLNRIHNVVNSGFGNANEKDKKELVKAKSKADIMSAGLGKSSQPADKKPSNQLKVLRKVNNSLNSWISKK